MGKWADYLISAVRYKVSLERKYILKLKVHDDKGDTVGAPSIWERDDVIKKIGENYSFVTIYKGDNNKWIKGENVKRIKVANNYYLRTDANEIEEDNLGELPEF